MHESPGKGQRRTEGRSGSGIRSTKDGRSVVPASEQATNGRAVLVQNLAIGIHIQARTAREIRRPHLDGKKRWSSNWTHARIGLVEGISIHAIEIGRPSPKGFIHTGRSIAIVFSNRLCKRVAIDAQLAGQIGCRYSLKQIARSNEFPQVARAWVDQSDTVVSNEAAVANEISRHALARGPFMQHRLDEVVVGICLVRKALARLVDRYEPWLRAIKDDVWKDRLIAVRFSQDRARHPQTRALELLLDDPSNPETSRDAIARIAAG